MIKTVILAAGEGTRMKSKLPKVLHKVLDKKMIDYVIEASEDAGSEETVVVVGHQAERVEKAIDKTVKFVEQKARLGTAHAVMQANDYYNDDDIVLILFGDTPMITGDTLKKMVDRHQSEGHGITVLSTLVDNPTGYGRIIRGGNGAFVKSVEHKDATEAEQKVNEINSGMYCFNGDVLRNTLSRIDNNNKQGEYYLPDTLAIALGDGTKVDAYCMSLSDEILGVNSRVQLAEVTRLMIKRINTAHMINGVAFINPDCTYIGKDVVIGSDTTIYPNTTIEGKCHIGHDNMIGPGTKIRDCVIGDHNTIEQSTLLESKISANNSIGPYAYIRPNSEIGNNIKIGDFVEVKNSTIGDFTKVSHLTYIGDADVGQNVNFGCGTVIVNYDGAKKHRTVIKDNAFIGCNTNLVSPVVVEKNGYTAAGSTITKDVPEYALAIARERQHNIDEWVKRSGKSKY